jgi:hypothetical protein
LKQKQCSFRNFINLKLTKMLLWFFAAAVLPLWGSAASPSANPNPSQPPCRFSKQYTQSQILKNPDNFLSDLLYWEGKFHQNNVSLNTLNGMSYDGTLIDPTTGIATAKHPFSAASKEASSLSSKVLH